MGKNLFETLIFATQLPDQPVRDEFSRILQKHGKNPETMSLEDVRDVLADYLQDIFLELKENSQP